MARKSKSTKKEKLPKKAKIDESAVQKDTNTTENSKEIEEHTSTHPVNASECSTNIQGDAAQATDGNKSCDIHTNTSTSTLDKIKRFRFPTARIKRIMQSDEDVGKISTYAPVVLGKATELFLVELVSAAMKHAEKNKRKMEVEDVIRVVKENEQFAFLKSYENEE